MIFDCPVRRLEHSDFRLLALSEYRRSHLAPSRLPLNARITLASVAAAVHSARQDQAARGQPDGADQDSGPGVPP